jgi:hypothetical protein
VRELRIDIDEIEFVVASGPVGAEPGRYAVDLEAERSKVARFPEVVAAQWVALTALATLVGDEK